MCNKILHWKLKTLQERTYLNEKNCVTTLRVERRIFKHVCLKEGCAKICKSSVLRIREKKNIFLFFLSPDFKYGTRRARASYIDRYLIASSSPTAASVGRMPQWASCNTQGPQALLMTKDSTGRRSVGRRSTGGPRPSLRSPRPSPLGGGRRPRRDLPITDEVHRTLANLMIQPSRYVKRIFLHKYFFIQPRMSCFFNCFFFMCAWFFSVLSAVGV